MSERRLFLHHLSLEMCGELQSRWWVPRAAEIFVCVPWFEFKQAGAASTPQTESTYLLDSIHCWWPTCELGQTAISLLDFNALRLLPSLNEAILKPDQTYCFWFKSIHHLTCRLAMACCPVTFFPWQSMILLRGALLEAILNIRPKIFSYGKHLAGGSQCMPSLDEQIQCDLVPEQAQKSKFFYSVASSYSFSFSFSLFFSLLFDVYSPFSSSNCLIS